MTLKEAVETDIDLDIHNFSDRQKQAVTKLLETCQLFLNSQSLVEDKPTEGRNCCTCIIPEICEECLEADSHNACNEANRIARVKALAGVEEVIEQFLHSCHCACLTDYNIKCFAQAIRQRFERG